MKALSVASGAILVSLITACGPSQDNAVKYNDKLVDIQNRAYGFFNKVDSMFTDEIWYYSPDDAEVSDFMSNAKSKYGELITQAEEVKDLEGTNEMKGALISLIEYLRQSVDTYYMALIEDEEGSQAESIDAEFNENFTVLEDAFLDAQKELADKFNMELYYEEDPML